MQQVHKWTSIDNATSACKGNCENNYGYLK